MCVCVRETGEKGFFKVRFIDAINPLLLNAHTKKK